METKDTLKLLSREMETTTKIIVNGAMQTANLFINRKNL